MAFWNRKQDEKKNTGPAVDPTTRTIVSLRREFAALRDDVSALRHEVAESRKRQPVPTNGKPHVGSAVQDWLPIVDRMQELLLVQMGNADLAQAFGTYARQRELRASEEQPDTAWTEPDESAYENI